MDNRHLHIVFAALLGAAGATICTAAYYQHRLTRELALRRAAVQAVQDKYVFQAFVYSVLEELNTLTGIRRNKLDLLMKGNEQSLLIRLEALQDSFPDRVLNDPDSAEIMRRAARYFEEFKPVVEDEEMEKSLRTLFQRIGQTTNTTVSEGATRDLIPSNETKRKANSARPP